MKRIVTLLILTTTTLLICNAQPNQSKNNYTNRIENFVSGLSATQKKKIEKLHKNCSPTICQLRKEQRQVRDSIATFSDLYGDYSDILYPLYEREAKLQIEISKHFYSKKVALDKILTKEQHEEFIKNMKYRRSKSSKSEHRDK